MKRIILVLSILIQGCLVELTAQTMFDYPSLIDSSSGSLYFNIHTSSFIKNNEYDGRFTKGFTGIGYFLYPEIQYMMTDKLALKLGAFLQQYSGREEFSSYQPSFRVEYRATEKFRMILGNIYGNLMHGLEEPLYRFDNYYQEHLESGVQFIFESEHFNTDLWLDWQTFIFTGDEFQEKFQLGLSSEVLIEKGDFSFRVPAQAIIAHKGGEIDVSPLAISNILNTSSGIDLNLQLMQNTDIGLRVLYFYYKALSVPEQGVNSQVFESGSASLITCYVNYKKLSSSLAYWNADSFVAPGGETLYHSVSDFDPDYFERERELIKYDLNWTHSISGLAELSLRLDLYYDLTNSELSSAMGLYLNLNESILLKK